MKKGQIAEGMVERVEFPNKGTVATDEGERVIVKNVIPGQRVRFCVNKARNGRAEGRLLEIVAKSPLEEDSPCPHFGVCGGCTYQSLPYREQLKLKEKQVRELLEHAIGGRCSYEFMGIKGSPREQEYRNKMEFSFGDAFRDGPLALGMHRRGSFYDIVTVDGCRIVDADFRKILAATLSYFSERGVPYYHRMRHKGYLRHLLVRKAVRTGEILVDLVTTTQGFSPVTGNGSAVGAGENSVAGKEAAVGCGEGPAAGKESAAGDWESPQGMPDAQGSLCPEISPIDSEAERALLEGWTSRLRTLVLEGSLKGILHTKNDSVADAVKNEGTEILYGADCFCEELLGLRFQISPFSFFQTNSLAAEVLYETVRKLILQDESGLSDKVVYDLYSGTGTIAQMLAPVCREVVGVEIVEEAVEAARENAAANGLNNCTFLAGDVLRVLDSIEQQPDYIVLDPPRDGVHPKALERIISYGVERMVYISCKPTSLARDLQMLLGRGYVVEKVWCVDMFPGTGHVETIVSIQKKNS